MPEKTTERKAFDLRLESASSTIRDEYYSLLSAEQVARAKANKGRPVRLSVEEREAILGQAERNIFYGRVDAKKMEKDWEMATSRDGRPPLGGALDD